MAGKFQRKWQGKTEPPIQPIITTTIRAKYWSNSKIPPISLRTTRTWRSKKLFLEPRPKNAQRKTFDQERQPDARLGEPDDREPCASCAKKAN